VEAYPGELARKRCAERTREELVAYQPARPLAFRDELRLRAMASRCGTCRACPNTLRALEAMLPPAPAEPCAQIIRLAG